MESRLPVTPLPPRHGHAGIVAVGLLAATTAVVWISRDDGPEPPARPTPAASVPRAAEEKLRPIELRAGVVTTVVREREFPRLVGATGPVTFDDARTNHLQTPVAGVLVKTRPSSLGRVVRAGENVGVVYSLEVLVGTGDLIAELRDFRGQEHVDRARVRLLRWGMRREQLARIEQSMTPSPVLPIIARVTGKVVDEAEGGQRQLIDSFGDLMTITDPTYATIYVDVPVADAERLRVGQVTRVQLGTAPVVTAPIGYIARSAEDGMKIVRVDLHPVRITTPPARWKEVEAKIELAQTTVRGPTIPVTAVTREGERALVYVLRGDLMSAELADPREVRLGPVVEDQVLIESGLTVGETIVIGR